MSNETNNARDAEMLPSSSSTRKRPLVQSKGFQQIALGATVFGIVVAVVERILHTIDAKAWNDLLLEAFRALLKQNGPWPVILLVILFAFIRLYHSAMMGQINAKDDEIRRLVQQREILEEKLDVRHSSRAKN